MEEEVSSGYMEVDDNTIEIEHENDNVTDLENKIDQPKDGIEFDSLDELIEMYTRYAKEKGFAVAKRSSLKMGGILTCVLLECIRAGKTNITSRDVYDEVSAKYILRRWSKNVKRGHTKIRIGYDNWSDRPEARRFAKVSHVFSEVCDLVVDSETLYDEVMTHALQMKERYEGSVEISGSKMPIPANTQKDSTSHGDGIGISKESTNILDPLVTRSKGRPPSKRKVGNVEKEVKKKSKAKKKTSTSKTIQGYDEHGTQGSIVLNSSLMRSNIHTPFIAQSGGNFAFQPNKGARGNFAF